MRENCHDQNCRHSSGEESLTYPRVAPCRACNNLLVGIFVGQKDTGAEKMLRRALHRIGLRYKLHDRSLPGSPDIVFSRYKATIFVHGCYWHSHGCYRSTVPKNHRDFWTDKFSTNWARDEKNRNLLLSDGWRVLTVWECALRGKEATSATEVAAP